MPRLFSVLPPLLLSASLLAIAGCNSGASDQPVVELARVRTAPAVVGPAAPSIRTNGLLVNEDEIRLSFKVTGVIRRLSVTEGEQVRKGQKLAEIEQAEINAQVEQAAQAHEEGASRCRTRRAFVCRQGHQPRTAAGLAHPARGE